VCLALCPGGEYRFSWPLTHPLFHAGEGEETSSRSLPFFRHVSRAPGLWERANGPGQTVGRAGGVRAAPVVLLGGG
jgi:hypothetical protein